MMTTKKPIFELADYVCIVNHAKPVKMELQTIQTQYAEIKGYSVVEGHFDVIVYPQISPDFTQCNRYKLEVITETQSIDLKN